MSHRRHLFFITNAWEPNELFPRGLRLIFDRPREDRKHWPHQTGSVMYVHTTQPQHHSDTRQCIMAIASLPRILAVTMLQTQTEIPIDQILAHKDSGLKY